MPSLADLVRCIACRTVYSKPCDGVTPGQGACCPNCASVAWLAVAVLPQAERPPAA